MITLRHFGPEDAGTIRADMYPDMTPDEILSLTAEWNTCVYDGRYFEIFAVVSEGRIVGHASICERSRSVVSAGVEIFCGERGKGYASGAMALLLKLASEKGYAVMLDQVRTDNAASVGLHEKLGFECDRTVYRNRRGHEVFLWLKPL